MRVSTDTVEEFLLHIQDHPLYLDTVYLKKHRSPKGGNFEDAFLFEVVLQISTVVVVKEGEQSHIVDCIALCGDDCIDEEEPDLSGSEAYKKAEDALKEASESMGFKILPGVVDF